MARTTLYVYGSLKRGQRNHHYLAGQQFLAEARTLPRYRLFACEGFACLVEDRQNGVRVVGELWSVTDDALRKIDVLEDAPVLYARREVALEDVAAPVWAYFFNGDVSGAEDCDGCWPPAR